MIFGCENLSRGFNIKKMVIRNHGIKMTYSASHHIIVFVKQSVCAPDAILALQAIYVSEK